MSNKKLKIQIAQLREALSYATTIEYCDSVIEFGTHVNYFKSVRQEAIEKYADALADILQNSIDIAVDFNKVESMPFDQKLMQHINKITEEYKIVNNL